MNSISTYKGCEKNTFFLATNGKLLHAIEKSTNTDIVIDNDEILIFGKKEDDRQSAYEKIQKIINAIIEIPLGDKTAFILGQKGVYLDKLRKETRCYLEVKNKENILRVFSHKKENVQKACDWVWKIP
eukprot:UN24070